MSIEETPCLGEELLAHCVEGRLSAAQREELELHLARCHSCLTTVAWVTRLSSSSRIDGPSTVRFLVSKSDREDERAPQPPPARVGRYIVLAPVGRGGMGIVYAAYDPQLHRNVALKILRSSMEHSFLLREAQLMARVAHPNVVTVYDVGLFEDQVFVAMEFVDGGTLRSWAEDHRSPEALLDLLIQAGEGLAAVHRAGLIHRDFKPDNVLVGKDGRARVTDFGLARFADGEGEDALAHALAGTPGYMPPEHRSEVSASSDQFSFCVTASELLGSRLPPRLHRILLRGTSRDPAARYPDMDALVVALRRARSKRRGFALVAVLLATLCGIVVWLIRNEMHIRM